MTEPGDGSAPIYEAKADLFKALAHPARVRALEVLVEGERSVSDLQPEVGIDSSYLSQQLGILRRAGLVTSRKEGTSVIYGISDPLIVDLLGVARRFLIASLAQTRELLEGLESDEASG